MIYRFKASIHGQTDFQREYELRGHHTLYDFHEHIQSDLGFAPDQMITFYSCDMLWKIKKEYGLFDTGNGSMDEHSMEELEDRNEVRLLYVFDIFHNRSIRLEFLGTDEEAPRKAYPRTAFEKGLPPDQFSNKINVMHIKDEDEPEENVADNYEA